MKEEEKPFDFIQEIQKNKTYHLLFPSRQQGLAMMHLYEGIKNGIYVDRRFKETDVFHALQAGYAADSGNYQRIPQERFVDMIGDLKEYFLAYDEERQVYIFKEYGWKFCEKAYEVLYSDFNPTKIELICLELYQQLEKVDGEEGLRNWLTIYFANFRPEMKSQVDFLDRHIDQAVADLRNTTGLQHQSIITILKQLDAELEQLRNQYRELRTAFQQMKRINDRLEQLSLSIEVAELYDQVTAARAFFPEIHHRLQMVDSRLDRIHPKLKQFFGTLNKPLFNQRVEKFLYFLLQHATLHQYKSKKYVEFPDGIPLRQLHVAVPDLPIIERRTDLFPVKPRTAVIYPENREQVKNHTQDFRSRLRIQDELEELAEKIFAEAKEHKSVALSDTFFSLVKEKEGDIELAAKFVHRIIKTVLFMHQFSLAVHPTLAGDKGKPGLTINEMILSYDDEL